ncbi:hypothetical protein H5410_052946 [Solanum commersonii]|uniref:Uncharacterized protein n=1 Tax=Solanum commersonii TaxID=4109 RepID=A0A9J5X3L4_SOLCO|nr:hypothetical protein H5410_052946 [Solanum commersonii]
MGANCTFVDLCSEFEYFAAYLLNRNLIGIKVHALIFLLGFAGLNSRRWIENYVRWAIWRDRTSSPNCSAKPWVAERTRRLAESILDRPFLCYSNPLMHSNFRRTNPCSPKVVGDSPKGPLYR